jgi:hypothetical protein
MAQHQPQVPKECFSEELINVFCPFPSRAFLYLSRQPGDGLKPPKAERSLMPIYIQISPPIVVVLRRKTIVNCCANFVLSEAKYWFFVAAHTI